MGFTSDPFGPPWPGADEKPDEGFSGFELAEPFSRLSVEPIPRRFQSQLDIINKYTSGSIYDLPMTLTLAGYKPRTVSTLIRHDLKRVGRGQLPLTPEETLAAAELLAGRKIKKEDVDWPMPWELPGRAVENLRQIVVSLPSLPQAIIKDIWNVKDVPRLAKEVLSGEGSVGEKISGLASLPGVRLVPGTFVLEHLFTDPEQLAQNPLFTFLDVSPYATRAAKGSEVYRAFLEQQKEYAKKKYARYVADLSQQVEQGKAPAALVFLPKEVREAQFQALISQDPMVKERAALWIWATRDKTGDYRPWVQSVRGLLEPMAYTSLGRRAISLYQNLGSQARATAKLLAVTESAVEQNRFRLVADTLDEIQQKYSQLGLSPERQRELLVAQQEKLAGTAAFNSVEREFLEEVAEAVGEPLAEASGVARATVRELTSEEKLNIIDQVKKGEEVTFERGGLQPTVPDYDRVGGAYSTLATIDEPSLRKVKMWGRETWLPAKYAKLWERVGNEFEHRLVDYRLSGDIVRAVRRDILSKTQDLTAVADDIGRLERALDRLGRGDIAALGEVSALLDELSDVPEVAEIRKFMSTVADDADKIADRHVETAARIADSINLPQTQLQPKHLAAAAAKILSDADIGSGTRLDSAIALLESAPRGMYAEQVKNLRAARQAAGKEMDRAGAALLAERTRDLAATIPKTDRLRRTLESLANNLQRFSRGGSWRGRIVEYRRRLETQYAKNNPAIADLVERLQEWETYTIPKAARQQPTTREFAVNVRQLLDDSEVREMANKMRQFAKTGDRSLLDRWFAVNDEIGTYEAKLFADAVTNAYHLTGSVSRRAEALVTVMDRLKEWRAAMRPEMASNVADILPRLASELRRSAEEIGAAQQRALMSEAVERVWAAAEEVSPSEMFSAMLTELVSAENLPLQRKLALVQGVRVALQEMRKDPNFSQMVARLGVQLGDLLNIGKEIDTARIGQIVNSGDMARLRAVLRNSAEIGRTVGQMADDLDAKLAELSVAMRKKYPKRAEQAAKEAGSAFEWMRRRIEDRSDAVMSDWLKAKIAIPETLELRTVNHEVQKIKATRVGDALKHAGEATTKMKAAAKRFARFQRSLQARPPTQPLINVKILQRIENELRSTVGARTGDQPVRLLIMENDPRFEILMRLKERREAPGELRTIYLKDGSVINFWIIDRPASWWLEMADRAAEGLASAIPEWLLAPEQRRRIAADVTRTFRQLTERGIVGEHVYVPHMSKDKAARILAAGEGKVLPQNFSPTVIKERTWNPNPATVDDPYVAFRAADAETVSSLVTEHALWLLGEFWGVSYEKAIETVLAKARQIAPDAPQYVIDKVMATSLKEWDPNKYLGSAGSKLTAVMPGQKMLMPAGVVDVLDAIFDKKMASGVPFLDPAMNLFRMSVLGLSARFMVNNMIGGFIMVAAHDPFAIKKLPAAIRMTKKVKDGSAYIQGFEIGRGFFGQPTEVIDWLEKANPLEKVAAVHQIAAGAKVGEILRKVATKNFRINQWFDDVYRTAALLSELDRRGLRMGSDGMMQIPSEHVHLYAQALDKASRVLQDWSAITPLERNVIRSIFPFYGWMFTLMRYLWNYPKTHPFAAGVVSTVAAKELEDWGHGSFALKQMLFPFGTDENGIGIALDLKAGNPFRDAANYFTLAGLARNVNPLAGAILQALGFDPASGGADLFPNLRFDEVEGQLEAAPDKPFWQTAIQSLVPQTRVLDALLGTDVWVQMRKHDPDAAARFLLSSMGVPTYLRKVDTVQQIVNDAIRQVRVAEQARQRAVSLGKPEKAEPWPFAERTKLKVMLADPQEEPIDFIKVLFEGGTTD